MLEVIAGSSNGVAVTLLVRPTALLDRFFQTVVEILIFPAFSDLGLIIEFDLVDQQAGKTLGLAVNVLILGRDRGNRRRTGVVRVSACPTGSGSASAGPISATADWTSVWTSL